MCVPGGGAPSPPRSPPCLEPVGGRGAGQWSSGGTVAWQDFTQTYKLQINTKLCQLSLNIYLNYSARFYFPYVKTIAVYRYLSI